MSEGRKRSRKSKLEVRSDVDVEETENATLQKRPHFPPKILDHTYSLKNGSTPRCPIQLSVKVEVEELDDESMMEIESEDTDDVLSLIAGPSSALINSKRKSQSSVRVFHVTLEKMYKISDQIAWSSNNPADKFLSIELKNIWGRVLKPEEDTDPHNILIQKVFKAWQIGLLSGKVWRDTPIFYQCHLCNLAWWYLDPFRSHIRRHNHRLLQVYLQENYHESIVVASNEFYNDIKYIKCEGNCYRCGRSFECHIKTPRHLYTCLECKDSLPVCALLRHHQPVCLKTQKIKLSKEHKCFICYTQFLYEQDLDLHMITSHLVRSDIPCPYLFKTCAVCEKQYHHFYTHMCTKSSLNACCTHCYRKFPTKYLSKLHIKLSNQNYQCKICNQIFPSKCMETEHLLTHTDKFKMAYKCINLQCPPTMLFADEKSIRLHRSLHHKQKYDKRRTYYELVLVPEQTQETSSIVDIDFASVCETNELTSQAPRNPEIDRQKNEQTDKEILQEDRDIKKEMQCIDADYSVDDESQDVNMDYEQMLSKVFKVSDSVRNAKPRVRTTEIEVTEIKMEPEDIDFETLIDQQENPITIKAEPCEIDEQCEIDGQCEIEGQCEIYEQCELDKCDIKTEPQEYDIECVYDDVITGVKMEPEDVKRELNETTDTKIFDPYSDRSAPVTKTNSERPISYLKQNAEPTPYKQDTYKMPTLMMNQNIYERSNTQNAFKTPTLTMNKNLYKRPIVKRQVKIAKCQLIKKYIPVIEKSKINDNNSIPVKLFLQNYKNNNSLLKQSLVRLKTNSETNRLKQNNTDLNPNASKRNTDIDSNTSNNNTEIDPNKPMTNTDIDPNGSEQNTELDPSGSKRNTDIDPYGSIQNIDTDPNGSKQNTATDPNGSKQNTATDPNGSKQNTATDPNGSKQNTATDRNGSKQNTATGSNKLSKRNTSSSRCILKQKKIKKTKNGIKKCRVYTCTKCGYTNKHKLYRIHLNSKCELSPTFEEDMRYKCTKCDTSFNTLKLYLIHFEKHGYAVLHCPSCNLKFEMLQNLLPHIHMHVRQNFVNCWMINKMLDDPTKKQHRCQTCRQIVPPENFFQHWENHLKLITSVKTELKPVDLAAESPDSTNEKTLQAPTLHMALQQLRSVLRERECFVCHRQFSRRHDCKRHIIEHLLLDAYTKKANTQSLRCQICYSEFFRAEQYKFHMREHGALPVYRCEICNKTFSDSSNFAKHKKVHSLKVLICDICKKKFHAKSSLEKHMMMHRVTEPIKCDQCTKCFYSKSHHLKHVKARHERSVKFRCIICDVHFDSLRKKWDHMWMTHKERKLKADCPICLKEFRKYLDVKAHAKEEHSVDLSFLKIKTGGALGKFKTFCKIKRIKEETIFIPPDMISDEETAEPAGAQVHDGEIIEKPASN